MCLRGVHGAAILIPYFIQGRSAEVFRRTLKYRRAKAVAEYAVAAYNEASVSCNQPLETPYRKAVGLRLYSWAVEQALKLLSRVEGRMTAAGRLAFRSSESPRGR